MTTYVVNGTYKKMSLVNMHVKSIKESRQIKYLITDVHIGIDYSDHIWIDGCHRVNSYFKKLNIGDKIQFLGKIKRYVNIHGKNRTTISMISFTPV